MKEQILSKVMAALQEAEEMGGLESDNEYVDLMNQVILDCSRRIHANLLTRSIP
jgi:hypothetical protein